MGVPPKAPIFYCMPYPSFAQCKKQFYGNFAQCKKHFHPSIDKSNDFTHT